MSRATGLHRPDPAKLARRAHFGATLKAGAPLGQATWTPCPRLNQKRKSICHTFSAAGAIWTRFNAAGKPLPFIPSPVTLASCVYADTQGPASTRQALADVGADLSDDATGLATWGIAPMLITSSDDGYSDVDPYPDDGTFPEADPSRLVIAGADLIDGEYQIPLTDEAPTLCALALDAGIPIWFGGPVNGEYENLGPGGIATAASTLNGSGHAQYLNSYRSVNGAFQFLIQGSWGNNILDNGAIWADESFVKSLWLLWPMDVKVPA
jgi:hypothetical protein